MEKTAAKKVKLEFPVEVDGEKITELTMRRPKVRDQRAASKQCGSSGLDVDLEPQLFANLCEVDIKVLDELDMLDYGKLQDAYRGFLSSGRKTPVKPA